jgi:hypothetical protein
MMAPQTPLARRAGPEPDGTTADLTSHAHVVTGPSGQGGAHGDGRAVAH